MPGIRRSKRSRKETEISDAGGEGSGTGDDTQTLSPTLGMEASDAEEVGRKTGGVYDKKAFEQMMAELLTCKPNCKCNSCRPDLDFERMCAKGLIEQHDGKDYVRYPKDTLQVFTVKFINFVGSGGRVRGTMRIPVIDGDYRLFGPDTGELPCIEIDPLGKAELADADCSLDVADSLDIYLKLQSHEEEKTSCQMMIKECVMPLWNPFTEPAHKCLCKRLDTELGPVEITFAVILDAVPAYVEVHLLEWLLEEDTASVDGTISVGNTDIGDKNALTYLFQKPPKDSVLVRRPLEEGSGVILPFSKHYTFVPNDSALQVYVQLKRRFRNGLRWIAREVLKFAVKPGDFEQQIIDGNYFKLGVNVTWSPNDLISFEERTKFYAEMRAARKSRLAGSK